jgi:retinol dehydrogenase-12
MAPFSILTGLHNQFRWLPKVKDQNMSGRVILVTGASGGLGLEAARHFARMKPARLILAVRNMEKGRAAAEDILHSTGYTSDVWTVDQADFKSVKAFCDRASKELVRLDIVLLNAGINTSHWEVTKDGYESSLQTNDISTSWMALRLLPIVQKTLNKSEAGGVKPHLVVVGSE